MNTSTTVTASVDKRGTVLTNTGADRLSSIGTPCAHLSSPSSSPPETKRQRTQYKHNLSRYFVLARAYSVQSCVCCSFPNRTGSRTAVVLLSQSTLFSRPGANDLGIVFRSSTIAHVWSDDATSYHQGVSETRYW